jgi:hypothetical protein
LDPISVLDYDSWWISGAKVVDGAPQVVDGALLAVLPVPLPVPQLAEFQLVRVPEFRAVKALDLLVLGWGVDRRDQVEQVLQTVLLLDPFPLLWAWEPLLGCEDHVVFGVVANGLTFSIEKGQ